jgi:hypothetical protein
MADDFSAYTDTTGSITVDASASGVLESAYDQDWFKVVLAAGETYQFTLSPASGAWQGSGNPTLTFWNPQYYSGPQGSSGGYAPVTQARDGAAPSIWVRPDVDGVYYLNVGTLQATGAYSVKETALAPDDYGDNSSTKATLAVGASIGGQLEVAGDHDAFRLSLVAGVTYLLTAKGGTEIASLPVTGFYSGNIATSALSAATSAASASSVSSFTPTTTGTYYAVASALDAIHGVGSYQLSLTQAPDDYAANVSGAGALAIGAAAKGNIDVPQDVDWLKVSLQANQSYSFVLLDSSNHAQLSMVTGQGGSLASAGTTITGVGQILNFAPSAAGDYYVQIDGGGKGYGAAQTWSGSYTVSAALSPTDDYGADSNTTASLAVGHAITGHVDSPSDQDWIGVHLNAGGSYLFDLSAASYANGATLQMHDLQLLDSGGNYLPSQSRSVSGKDILVSFTATVAGDYFLNVNGSGAPLSTYNVTAYGDVADDIAGNASTTASLSQGSVVHSAIDAPTDHDWYRVDLDSYTTYTFAVDAYASQEGSLGSAGGYAVLALYDANGNLVRSVSGSATLDPDLPYTYFGNSGTYYLEVSAQGMATGTYTVKESNNNVLPDTTPPHSATVTGPTGISALSSNLLVNFHEKIHLGSGVITLGTAAGAAVESFDAATSAHLSTSNGQLVIDPSVDLLPDTDYVVTASAGSVTDDAGNASVAPIVATFHSSHAPDHWIGGAGDDVFIAGSAGGSYDGGAGRDTLVIGESYAGFSVHQTPLATVVSNQYGTGETYALTSIERIQFNNHAVVALDIDGHAGQVYRLYQAAFGRTPDITGLGYWIAQADKGLSQHDIANSFVTSGEFNTLYGAAASDGAFLTALYQNVLHRAPDQGGQDYWLGQMQHGMAHAEVLMAFSESTENQIATFAAIHNGIAYIPY